jgi:hypothetical protein
MLCQQTFREATPDVRHRSDQVEIAADASTRAVPAKASAFSAEMSEGKRKSGRANDGNRPRPANMPSASPEDA